MAPCLHTGAPGSSGTCVPLFSLRLIRYNWLQTYCLRQLLRLYIEKTAPSVSIPSSVLHPLPFQRHKLTCPQDDEPGLNVCLTCFNGGCTGPRDHARLHFERFGHPLALNIKRRRKNVQVGRHHFVSARGKRRESLSINSEKNHRKRSRSLQSLRRQMKIVMIRVPRLFAISATKIMLRNQVASFRY
jgi:hypothetical protein